MAIEQIKDADFQQSVIDGSNNQPVLVDFWAEWCGPCKMIAPSVEKISEEYSDKLKVGKLDVDSNPNISSTFGIRSIPTLLIFKNGTPVDQIVGAVSKDAISSKVDNHI